MTSYQSLDQRLKRLEDRAAACPPRMTQADFDQFHVELQYMIRHPDLRSLFECYLSIVAQYRCRLRHGINDVCAECVERLVPIRRSYTAYVERFEALRQDEEQSSTDIGATEP